MGLFDFFKKNDKNMATKVTIPAEDYLDDITFIEDMKHLVSGPWHQYDILLAARGYGWDMMKDWADYMTTADLEHVSQVAVGALGMEEIDVIASYNANNQKCKDTPELEVERGMLSVAGMSNALKSPTKIVWINQTRTLRLFAMVDDELMIKKYVETMVRRTFGTENAMKIGKPLPNE